eukprot:4808623-Amphidinium_carterae.1
MNEACSGAAHYAIIQGAEIWPRSIPSHENEENYANGPQVRQWGSITKEYLRLQVRIIFPQNERGNTALAL